MKISPEEQFILLSSNLYPTKQDLIKLKNIFLNIKDWDYFTDIAIKKQAAPLVLNIVKKNSSDFDIPSISKHKLEQAWFKTLSRSMVYIKLFQDIVFAFKNENISVIPLKGIFLAEWLYKEVGLRQFSDMDLLIHQEDLNKAVQILHSMGFVTSGLHNVPDFVTKNTSNVHYPPLVRQGMSVELHLRIHRKTEEFCVEIDDLWNNAIIQVVNNVETLTFCLTDLLLHICLHLHVHFYISKVQFTGFYDIANIMNQYSDSIDWKLFDQNCHKYNAINYTYKYILLSGKYLGSPIPQHIKDKYGNSLRKSDERHFFQYLRNDIIKIDLMKGQTLKNINQIGSLSERIKYIFLKVFPSKAFMIERYHITNNKNFIFFYFKRMIDGYITILSFLIAKIRR